MEMDIITRYCMALECAEIFSRFLMGSSFMETKNKILMRYGAEYDEASKKKFDGMFALLDEIYTETIHELPDTPEVFFFFKPHYAGDIYSSVGYMMLINFLDIRAHSVREFIDHAKEKAEEMLKKPLHLTHVIYNAMVLEEDKEGKTLLENLKEDINSLPYDSEFKWNLYLALSDFESYSEKLAQLLETIEGNLRERLKKMDPIARELAKLRRDTFDDMKIEELAESMALPLEDIRGKRVVLCMLCMPCHQLIMDEGSSRNELPMFLGVAAEWGNKYHEDSVDRQLLCEALRIIGEESKFEILLLLSKGVACSKEIAANTELDPTTISRHLNMLLKQNLIRVDHKEKRNVYYRTNREELNNLLTLLRDVLC